MAAGMDVAVRETEGEVALLQLMQEEAIGASTRTRIVPTPFDSLRQSESKWTQTRQKMRRAAPRKLRSALATLKAIFDLRIPSTDPTAFYDIVPDADVDNFDDVDAIDDEDEVDATGGATGNFDCG